MTLDEQRIAIAEIRGWKAETYGPSWCESETRMPDYPRSLDAMHEAWCSLTESQHYVFREYLKKIVIRDGHVCGPCRSMTNATAAQRAEAYLRTLNKWKD